MSTTTTGHRWPWELRPQVPLVEEIEHTLLPSGEAWVVPRVRGRLLAEPATVAAELECALADLRRAQGELEAFEAGQPPRWLLVGGEHGRQALQNRLQEAQLAVQCGEWELEEARFWWPRRAA